MKKFLVLLGLYLFEFWGIYVAVSSTLSAHYFYPFQSAFTPLDYFLFAGFGMVIILLCQMFKYKVIEFKDNDPKLQTINKIAVGLYSFFVIYVLVHLIDIIVPGSFLAEFSQYDLYFYGYITYPLILTYYSYLLYKNVKLVLK